MTINDEYDFLSIDDDMLLGEEDYIDRTPRGDNVFWTFKRDKGQTDADALSWEFYFLTDFWNSREDHGWWTWREVFAAEGFTTKDGTLIEPAPGLYGVPVSDKEVVEINGVRKLRDVSPSAPHYDHLYGLVTPYLPRGTKATRPFRPVDTKMAANILRVHPDGSTQLQLMELSENRGKKVKQALQSWRDMDSSFSAVGRRFKLVLTGKAGAAETLLLKPVTDAPPVELPEPFDIPAKLQERRQRIVEYLRSHGVVVGPQGEVAPVAETAAPAEQAYAAEAPAPGEEPVEHAALGNREELYASWGDTMLKTKLTKAGIAYPPGAERDTLLQLAIDNQI